MPYADGYILLADLHATVPARAVRAEFVGIFQNNENLLNQQLVQLWQVLWHVGQQVA